MVFRSTWVALLLGCLLQAQNKNPEVTTVQPNVAAATPEAPPFVTCPAGAPIGAVDLQVQVGDQHLPFRTINRLSEGDTLRYAPILRGKEKRPGEIALVLVPQKLRAGQEAILVTEPKAADKPEEWQMTQTVSVAAATGGDAVERGEFLGQCECCFERLRFAVWTCSSDRQECAGGGASEHGVRRDEPATDGLQPAGQFHRAKRRADCQPSDYGGRALLRKPHWTGGGRDRDAAGSARHCVPGYAVPRFLRAAACQFRQWCQSLRAARRVTAAHASRLHLGKPHPEHPGAGDPRRRSGIPPCYPEDAASGGCAGDWMEVSGSRARLGLGERPEEKDDGPRS